MSGFTNNFRYLPFVYHRQEKFDAYLPSPGSPTNGKVWASWLRVPEVSGGCSGITPPVTIHLWKPYLLRSVGSTCNFLRLFTSGALYYTQTMEDYKRAPLLCQFQCIHITVAQVISQEIN